MNETALNKIKTYLLAVDNGKCNAAFSFLKCALQDTEELKEIWKLYDDGLDFKVYKKLIQITLRSVW